MPNAILLCCIWLPEFHLLPDVTITCPIGGLSVPVVECNPVTLSRVNRILFVANCNYHLPSWWLIFSCCQVHSYYMAIGLHFCCRLPLYWFICPIGWPLIIASRIIHLLPIATIICPIGGRSIFSCCQVQSYYVAVGIHFCCRLQLCRFTCPIGCLLTVYLWCPLQHSIARLAKLFLLPPLFFCVYIHVWMCVCVSECVCVCVCVCVYARACMVSLGTCVCVCVCVFVWGLTICTWDRRRRVGAFQWVTGQLFWHHFSNCF